jgi:esterase/lipase
MAGVRRVLRWLGVGLALLVAVAVVVAFIPLSRSGLDQSTPAPLPSAAAARAAVAAQVAAERDIKPQCHSRLLQPTRTPRGVIVLLHGIATCPAQMQALATLLVGDGYVVYVPLLPEHGELGGTGSSLNGLTEQDYRRFGDRTVDVARGFRVPVTVLGVSAGADVASWIGLHRRDVDSTIAVSPALGFGHVPGFVTTGFMNLFARVPSIAFPYGVELPHRYGGLATQPLAKTFNFGRALLDAAGAHPPAARRTVTVLNEHDHSTSNDLALKLAGRMHSVVQALPAALKLPDDCIDPREPGAKVKDVYPLLVSLAEDAAP